MCSSDLSSIDTFDPKPYLDANDGKPLPIKQPLTFAAGKTGRTADALSCAFSVPANASPAARCAAIRRQCGGKFYANYCGDKLLSAM